MTRYQITLVSLLFLIACHKDSDEVITIIDQPDPPEVLITTRLVTIVTPSPEISPVEIYVAGQTLTFQEHQFTQMKSSGIDRDFELLRIRTSANLDFYHVRPLMENDVNYTHVSFPVLHNFNGTSTEREDFSIPGGTRISVPAMSLLNQDSTVYEGTYVLHAGNVDSTSYGIPVPGYLGRTMQNENKILLFQKCFYVSVSTEDGQPLIFSEEAQIVCPGTYEEKWRFDAGKAIWYPTDVEGALGLERIPLGKDLYYAFAAAEKTSRTSGTLKINGQPTPNYPIKLIYDKGEQFVLTTNNGQWTAYLPAGMACKAVIYLPWLDWHWISFNTSDDPESSALLSVESADIINAHITGTARDCDFAPLQLNFTEVTGAITPLIFSENPQLKFNIPVRKQSKLNISSIDPTTGEQGPFIEWSAEDTIQIYSTLACEKANNEYLSLSVSDEQKIYWQLASQSDGNRLIIANDMTDPDLDFQVFIEGMNEGDYADQMLNIIFEDMALGSRGYSLYCPTATSGCGFKNFTITHFAQEEGQWIRGVFEGKFWIKTFHPLTAGYRNVKGEFQVFREF